MAPQSPKPKDNEAKATSKHLVANVTVAGRWYGPDYPGAIVTAEVAEQITNPDAWSKE